MAEDYAEKADELSKKAVEQSFGDNDAGDILEPSPRVMQTEDCPESASDNDGDEN